MRKSWLWLWLILGLIPAAEAQTGAVNGFCDTGASQAAVSGLLSTNFQQGDLPLCTVTVYLTGTTTPVPGSGITADASGTPLGNPFTANTNGQWLFYAATGQGYDIVLSSGVTLTDVFPDGGSGGGGSGTVTNVSTPTDSIVSDVDITYGGIYTGCPTDVQFTGGGGTGAAGQPHCSSEGGGNLRVDSVQMTSNGSGYFSAPSVTFIGGSGSAAATGTADILGFPSWLLPSVTNSTTTPSIRIGVQAQSPHTFLRGPSGTSAGPPFFGDITPADLPEGSAAQLGGVQCGSGTSCTGGIMSVIAVTALNGLTGGVTISCGSGLNCPVIGNTIAISLASPFAITSFTGGSVVELGTSIVNPSFIASYSVTPASAQITNTEGIDSPLVLVSPFTAGTVVGTFVHNAVATTTFTLSATFSGVTQTATQEESWQPAIFAGVGTAGATSSVTASGTTAVLSTSDVLGRLQLGAESVGQNLGTFNPSGQVVYLLLMGASHTFQDVNTGFPVPFNAPISVSFVNVQGVTVSMYLYAMTNPAFVPVTLKVAS